MLPNKGQAEVDELLHLLGLGVKLRSLRQSKKISLVDLGKHTGLSPSMLSQLENDKLIPTLPTLTRIAMVFDVGLGYFFADSRQTKPFTITRAEDRVRLAECPDSPSSSYFFECLAYSAEEQSFHSYLAHFPLRETHSEFHSHDGFEMVFVIDGAIEIVAGGQQNVISQGDSVYFDSSQPHAYRGVFEGTTRALVVCSAPFRN